MVNAGILQKMNAFWQKIFLTIGVLIAVFGMRLIFPVVIVAVSAKIGPIEAVDLALNDADRYQELVTDAHPSIAAFGGMFLLMIFLDFIFEERDIQWRPWRAPRAPSDSPDPPRGTSRRPRAGTARRR
ncbi:hypothetical protein STANM309S_05326 [Streptomyces tanashiensis]